MNAFRNPFILVLLFCSLFLVKCSCTDDTDEASLIELISKEWKISALTVDGNAITTGTEDFTLGLNRDGNTPTTFTVTTGGLAYNFAGALTGSWSLNNNENPTQATFAGNTVSFTASETQLTATYNQAGEPGKPQETVRFVLVPR
jgi:hypothetical protein